MAGRNASFIIVVRHPFSPPRCPHENSRKLARRDVVFPRKNAAQVLRQLFDSIAFRNDAPAVNC
jgi:hypothetical protein